MLAVMRTSHWILLLVVSVAFLHHVSGGNSSSRNQNKKEEEPPCQSECKVYALQTCTNCIANESKQPGCGICKVTLDSVKDKKNLCDQCIAESCHACNDKNLDSCKSCDTVMKNKKKVNCGVCKRLQATSFVANEVCFTCKEEIKEMCGKCRNTRVDDCTKCKSIVSMSKKQCAGLCGSLETETREKLKECDACTPTTTPTTKSTAAPTTKKSVPTTPSTEDQCKACSANAKDNRAACTTCFKGLTNDSEKCDICIKYNMDRSQNPCKNPCKSSPSTSKTGSTQGNTSPPTRTTTKPRTTTRTTTTTRPTTTTKTTTTTPRPSTTKATTTTPKVVTPPPTPSPARISSIRSTTTTLATPHPPPNKPLTVPVQIIDEPEPSTEPPIKAVATNPSVDGNGQKEDEGSNLTAVFVGLGVGAVVLLLVGAGIATGLVVRKKLKNKKKQKGSVKTKEDLERALVEAEAHGVAGDVGMGLVADLPPVPMPVRRPIHAKRQGAMKTTGPVRQMEAGKIIKTGFAFEGPLHFDATGNHGPLVHATEGQKSHSLRDVFFSDQMNRVFDMGSEIEHVVKSEEHDVSKKKSTVDEQKKDSKKDSKKNTTPPAPPAPDPNQPPPPSSQPPVTK